MATETHFAECPWCERVISGHESTATVDGELMHLECALEEADEVGMDDDFGCNG